MRRALPLLLALLPALAFGQAVSPSGGGGEDCTNGCTFTGTTTTGAQSVSGTITSSVASGSNILIPTTNGARICADSTCASRISGTASVLTLTSPAVTASGNINGGSSSFITTGTNGIFSAASGNALLLYSNLADGATAVATRINAGGSMMKNAGARLVGFANMYSVRGYLDRDAFWNGGVHARGGLRVITLDTPVNTTHQAVTTGGSLAADTYYYRVSATNAFGETLASTETSIATTGATSIVRVRWTPVPGATGYKVYCRATGAQELCATLTSDGYADNLGTLDLIHWIDDGSVTPSGALPTANTTGGMQLARGTLPTCAAGLEDTVMMDAVAGASTGNRSRPCICQSDGSASYAWANLYNGTVGTTTTCGASP